MGFLGIYRAIYEYTSQTEGELSIGEGDLLYVLEKDSNNGWWKAKKKADSEDEDEPEGLVPNNYLRPAPVLSRAHAIYDYTRQTDEELSFSEDALLDVFDTSDPNWILAGLDTEYGFVPANYIELRPEPTHNYISPPSASSSPLARTQSISSDQLEGLHTTHSAAVHSSSAPADHFQRQTTPQASILSSPNARPSRQPARSEGPHFTRGEGENEKLRAPILPSRPQSTPSIDCRGGSDILGPIPASQTPQNDESHRTPGGFHLYNINEMVSVMGKRKKMPTTLGINLKMGTILIAPEHLQDDPAEEWTADKMTHYSREGKHVFMELVRPSKSIDFHAGAKDTADEIVSALGELAGASRAEGLREVIMAGSQRGQRKGQVLYDFMAQGDDEVTLTAGDEIVVLDDSKCEEWWQVRCVKNGNEGVVPSSYIEIITAGTTPPAMAGLPVGLTRSVDQNRRDEIRLTREAIKASKEPQQAGQEVHHPQRFSSLKINENGNHMGQKRSRRESDRYNSSSRSKAKSKPNSSKVRTWTDRSGSFSVEAQFLDLKDGKIHLHKMNGVRIAVPIAKMSQDDLEHVERITGVSLDDDKPLADVRRSKSTDRPSSEIGASVGKTKKSEYDWFQFFLSCEVSIGLCERYAQAFIRDSMDESVLPDVNATILRTLGLREGDIIKVMRALDTKYARNRSREGDEHAGGLFSGPGGALRNNTRKGRPSPAIAISHVKDLADLSRPSVQSPKVETDHKGTSSQVNTDNSMADSSFEDNAWDVKLQVPKDSKLDSQGDKAVPTLASTLAGSMNNLSLLTEPLQPTRSEGQQSQTANSTQRIAPSQPIQQFTGAGNPGFCSPSNSVTQLSPPNNSTDRQRPVPSSAPSGQGLLIASPWVQKAMFGPLPGPLPMTSSVQSPLVLPGQSLSDVNQLKLQPQYTTQLQQRLQPAVTGFASLQPPGIAHLSTTKLEGQQQQFAQPMMTSMTSSGRFENPGQQNASFSSMPTQSTGYQPGFIHRMPTFNQGHSSVGGINNILMLPLEPQQTGMPSRVAGTQGSGSSQPLHPQRTGPPPAVRFGVTAEKKTGLTALPTGRRANLSQATPENPFGF